MNKEILLLESEMRKLQQDIDRLERENKQIEQQIKIEHDKKTHQEKLIADWDKDQQQASQDKRDLQEKVAACNA